MKLWQWIKNLFSRKKPVVEEPIEVIQETSLQFQERMNLIQDAQQAGRSQPKRADVNIALARSVPNTISRQRPTPVRTYGESELTDRGYVRASRTQPIYDTSPVHINRDDNSFLDGVVTALAVDAVVDMVADSFRPEPVERAEPAYIAPEREPVWQTEQPRFTAPEPSYTPPATTSFDDNRSSSWGNDSSSNWVSDVVDSVSSTFD
jgi:hypothetical protein